MKTGVCSITLRQLGPAELIKLVEQSGLDAIEWGGDIHVPPGEADTASSIRKMTEDAGLEVSSYGSYWKTIDEEGRPAPFEPVLESALALGTDTIRIWAGTQPSDAVSDAERQTIIETILQALEASEKHGVKLALEFHANTLSDSNGSTLDLLHTIPGLFTYWQPIYWLTDMAYRLRGLEQLAERVLNLHVFQWQFRPGGDWGASTDRRPLAEGANEWKNYFGVSLDSALEHYALMEFVRGDDPEQFLEDAATLKSWFHPER